MLGDSIDAGGGRNLVFGDNGQIYAGGSNASRFGALPLTLGLVQTIESLLGGADSITTGSGDDMILGGINGDTINAGDGNNVVIGDSGQIVWTAREFGGTGAGDDLDAADIDRVLSTDPDDGGSDTITTGSGDDVIVGGEDGEVVSGAHVSSQAAVPTIVGDDPARLGDVINAGNGRNLVFGDNGAVYAASSNAARFGALPITLGLVQTIESLLGGADSITTGSGDDVVLGGINGDTINAGDGNNVVIGDSGQIVWTAARVRRHARRRRPRPGGHRPLLSTNPDDGGSDSITTGSGDDVIVGGEDGEVVSGTHVSSQAAVADDRRATTRALGDSIIAGDGRNLVFGDNGEIYAAASNASRFGALPITLGLVADDRVADRRRRLDHDRLRRRHRPRRDQRRHDQRRRRQQLVIGDSGLIDWTAAEHSTRPRSPATTRTRPTSTGSSPRAPTTAAAT